MKIAEAIKRGEAELIRADSHLGELIKAQRPIVRTPRTDYFASLARAIIGQQVSVAAATAIYDRLEVATRMQPEQVLYLTEEQVRRIGLSRQKATYLRDLARHFVEQPTAYSHLGQATDEEVVAELTTVKGIGTWTAQMFLMFTLARLDVFAPGDAGLQRAMCQLYEWDAVPPPATLESVAETWRPYRTVACWHLWASLSNTPA